MDFVLCKWTSVHESFTSEAWAFRADHLLWTLDKSLTLSKVALSF